MPDREKVIKGLERCKLYNKLNCDKCPYDYNGRGNRKSECTAELATDALALLKEQKEKMEHLNNITLEYEKEVFRLQAMLKEQEAKVLTVDQLEDALGTVVWLETPVSENLADGYSLIMAYSHKYGYMYFDSPFNPSPDRLEYLEYGKSWRCWNKRPTDEQRQAVKWDD